MTVLGVIPARIGSVRLQRKPLQLLRGQPLIVRVLARVSGLDLFDQVVVATDAPEVMEAVERSGGRAVMTSDTHQSGTERVAEVASLPEFARYELLVNVQGDEPFVSEAAIRGALERVRGGDQVGTAAAPLEPGFAGDPSRVKVVLDRRGRALYFSRAAIPHQRDPAAGLARYWQHVGVYAYGRRALEAWVTLPATELEQTERLEQLRPLAHGWTVGVALLDRASPPGIDTLDDLRLADLNWDVYSTGDR